MLTETVVQGVIAVALVLAVITPSAIVWSAVGLLRAAARRKTVRAELQRSHLTRADVAVVIAARNEELGIAATVRSAHQQVPHGNVFVASDCSDDRTVEVAAAAGASVYPLPRNLGKAGAIVAALDHFDLVERFEVVLLLDADTQLDRDYLATGLRQFADPDVVAVAGRARSADDPRPATWAGRMLTAYRERVYVLMQYMFKYGQAAAGANAVTIVPGFASMYRTRVLDDIDIDAPGLSIEDFNMTFEVHARRLGRVAFDPEAAIAETQDPATVRDYTRQVRRWTLGFWQTVRRHGPHVGVFWAALAVHIVELVFSSVVAVLAVPALIVSVVSWLIASAVPGPGPLVDAAVAVSTALPPLWLALGILVPDLLLTLLAALLSRRLPSPSAWAFPAVRVLDSLVCLRTLGQAASGRSDGRWTSPVRRAVAA